MESDASAEGTESSGSSESSESTGSDLPTPLPDRIAITANFTAGTVSVLDLDALIVYDDSDIDITEFELRSFDYSDYAPGPLEIEFVPGRREAIVAVGPGFFGGIVGNLIDAGEVAQSGALLHISLDSGEVLASMDRPIPPMGIAITPDANTVLVADYGNEATRGDTVSFIDLESFAQVDQVVVGPGPEQIDISADGQLAIVNAAGAGTVRTFELADPSGTLSAPLVTSDDPSWPVFVGTSKEAVVTNSAGPSNWSLVDMNDPTAPVLVEQGETISGFPYGLAQWDADRFVLSSMTVGRTEVHVVDLSLTPSAITRSWVFSDLTAFPLGIAIDRSTDTALVPLAGTQQLGVVYLDDRHPHNFVPYDSATAAAGPTYVAIEP